MKSKRTATKKTPKRPFIPGPDVRNIPRGERWLREMIGVSEAMDEGKKKSMQAVLDEMEMPLLSRREREPGED